MNYRNTGKLSDEFTACPDKYPQGYFKDKVCRWCGNIFKPIAPSHLLCSDKCKDEASSEAYLRRNYGITREEYLRMYEDQKGLCKICGLPGFKLNPYQTLTLVVDHDHDTKEVRGLLCHNCNRALGLLKDSVSIMKSAISYLESATTISKESTPKRVEAVGTRESSDDIV